MPPKTSLPQLTEEEVQFKKRANRRLLGAVALVLLMVALLPMVLDDRAQKTPPQQEIAITIPSKEGGEFTSKIVPVMPDESIEDLPPVTQAPDKQTEPAANPGGDMSAEKKSQEPVPLVPVESKPKETVLIPTEKEQAKPEKQKAVPVKNPPSSESATAEAFVQIGVFSDAANVRQMQEKLKSLGYKSFTEKLDTSKGEKIRLRAGPFASRSDAEAALEKIKAAGLGGMAIGGK